MKEWLFNKFDQFMIKHRRKLVLVDIYGNEMMHRYAILHRQDPENAIKNEGSRWPNIFIHRALWEESPDGPVSHSHVSTTLSFILKGEYWEEYRGEVLHRDRFSINIVKFPEVHKIIRAKKDTWSIWIRWFARSNTVQMKPSSCENICEYCAEHFGRCFNEGKQFDYELYANQFNSKNNKPKVPTFFYAGPDTDRMIEKRKRAAKILGITTPIGEQAQLEASRGKSNLVKALSQEDRDKVA